MFQQRANEGRTITIYDIAKEAGVSAATVSRVLTNSANVSAEKRERVMALVEKYNFEPNALAKGLVNTKTRTIGVLAADIRNPYYAALFVACERAAREVNYSVTLCNSFGGAENEKTMLKMLQAQRVDAIIQMGGSVDDLASNEDYVEAVNQTMATTPVIITGKLDGTRCHSVRIDSMMAMELLLEHLINLGHRRIALIGGRKNVLATFEKHQRYKQILKANMIEYIPELIAEDSGYDFESGYSSAKKLLEGGVIPTAIIAINDFSAIGIMRYLSEKGLRVPEDISVVSYDNTYMSQMVTPRLTTVDYNYDEFGRKLIDTTVSLIEGRKSGALRMITPTLIVRESSARVKEEAE